jgi:hypothetical protein
MINPTGEQLANALHSLGVNFIMGGVSDTDLLYKDPARLISALAESNEARLRLSLIPLFLDRPEFSIYIHEAIKTSNKSAQLTIKCYYSAAVWFQKIYHSKIELFLGKKPPLPDYFSDELKVLITENPETNLRELAVRHKFLSGEKVNWLGTYHHAAQIWIKGLELQYA